MNYPLNLRGYKFQNFPGGACPQTPLASGRYRTLEFPPSTKKSFINPWLVRWGEGGLITKLKNTELFGQS